MGVIGIKPGSSVAVDFGLDAPPIVYSYAALGMVGIVLLVVHLTVSGPSVLLGWAIWALALGWGGFGLMVYSSTIGKVGVRDRLLDTLELHGTEDVLDLGCGSGLMLLGAATRVPAGTATGLDLWRSRDQAGSNRDQCLANADRLGVADRVTLVDGDMSRLPFADDSFDLILACLAVHNLHPRERREVAIREAIRVLRPAGRIAIVDIFATATYARTAERAGLLEVRRSGLVRGIFPPARTVTGRLPEISR
jgi:SAM-dependent methyltransferase